MTVHDFTSGSVLAGQYQIVREIGRGGMATVYLASDHKHDRQVAIKILHADLSLAIGAERFSREIRTLARLQHPHILSLFDSGQANGRLYFVMPFIDGESLRELIDREGALDLAATASIVRQIGEALDYSHTRGIVHRDVKPENILLSQGRALLSDFGVASALKSDGLQTLTSEGTTLGTPYYMSPEQASAERDIDGRSDLYSLGCIVHELLSGGRPFSGANPMATMAQHIAKNAPRLVGLRTPLSEDVVDAVSRMLSKDPNERFQTAASFTAVFDAVMHAEHPAKSSAIANATDRAPSGKATVFVIDFNNITLAADIDWLSGGIAETVSVDLKRVSGIRVVGTDLPTRQRVTAARAAGVIDAGVARQLGRAVGARWVIWGSFQKSGARLRLTPQFSDVESGEVVSAEKIDGLLENIFELQDRIVTRLAEILRIELTTDEAKLIAQRETVTFSAYEFYARGRQAFQAFGTASAAVADECFRKAIELDPNYALAWVGLGSLLMPKFIASGDTVHFEEGMHAMNRALQLDPTLGEPHVFIAYLLLVQGNVDESIAKARIGIDRDPGGYLGWYLLGIGLISRGLLGKLQDLARAVPPLLRARSINSSSHPSRFVAGSLYLMRGEYEHARKLTDEAVALELAGVGLAFLGAYVSCANVYFCEANNEKAHEWLDLAIAKYPPKDHVYSKTVTAWAYFLLGRLAERERDYINAAVHYHDAIDTADRNAHRAAIGAHWANSKLGLARIAHTNSNPELAAQLMGEAIDMINSKHRFRWNNFPGSSAFDSWYEISATQALLGDAESATESLGYAASIGWANTKQFEHDASFDNMRDDPQLQSVVANAATLVTLPPPVGAGGLPDFSDAFSFSGNL